MSLLAGSNVFFLLLLGAFRKIFFFWQFSFKPSFSFFSKDEFQRSNDKCQTLYVLLGCWILRVFRNIPCDIPSGKLLHLTTKTKQSPCDATPKLTFATEKSADLNRKNLFTLIKECTAQDSSLA